MPALALTLAGETTYLDETPENRDQAMRRYWEAKQRGDTTANLARIDAMPQTPANRPFDEAPDDDDPPPSVAAAARPTPAGEISDVALARIRLQESWCTKAGFALAPPLYAPGTRVLPLGDTNFRTERRRVEALPPFLGAAAAITAAIRTEARQDLTIRAGDIAMTDYGTLVAGDSEYALDISAFYQLSLQTGFGMGARYLAERCDGELRAHNVNVQLRKSAGKLLTLRTRASEDTRAVYATVTPAYAAVDTDRVLAVVGPELADARTEMVYDGTGVRATALWMPDEIIDLAAGDVFRAGVRIETDDTGRGRIRVSAVVFRNRCLNLLIIGEGVVETVSAVHKGSPDAILARVASGIAAARSRIADFLAAWGHARTVKVDAAALLREFVTERKLAGRSDAERDHVVEALLAAWHKEPGDTLADAVNAVSRAAHENPVWDMNYREELERQAARLVLVPR